MSFREMVLHNRFQADLTPQEKEGNVLSAFFKSQSPLMLGMFALMGLNLLVLLVTFQ